MKKWIFLLLCSAVVFTLASCDQSAESDLTVEEIYKKVSEKEETIESYEASIHMKQTIADAESDTVREETEDDSTLHITMDPLAMYIDTTSNESYEEITGDIPETDTEMYIVDDAVFYYSTYSGNDKEWVKMPGITDEMAKEMVNEQIDLEEKLEIFDEYGDDLSLEQADGEYVFKLDMKGNDEAFDRFVKDYVTESMGDMNLGQVDLEINQMSMETTIDEETFFVKNEKVDMDITMETDGVRNNVMQTLETTYSSYNDVEAIEVPEEVKENAEEQ